MVSGVTEHYHAHMKVVLYAVHCIVDESIDRVLAGRNVACRSDKTSRDRVKQIYGVVAEWGDQLSSEP